MNLWARQLALGLLLTAAIPSAAVRAADSAEQTLLDKADYWRLQDRPDRVRESLDQLLTLNPGQPGALYRYGVLELQQGNVAKARSYLARLRRAAPGDARIADLQASIKAGRIEDRSGSGAGAPLPTDAQSDVAAAPAYLPAAAGGSAPKAGPVPPLSASLDAAARSADSDDLTPVPQRVQLASLPAGADNDAGGPDPMPAPDAPGAPPPQPVVRPRERVAQLELQIPPPIGGYQPPAENGEVPEQDLLELDIERSMAAIQAETSPVLEAGIIYRGRAGQGGLSALNEVAGTVDGRFSPWLTGTMDVMVSPIYLDAGGAPGPTALPLFGANPILQANALALVPAGAQNAGGVLTSVGYSLGPFSARVGESAWGFPVTNVIGNVAYQPRFLNDTLSFRLEGLRQPVTDSLLSYAGTRASLTAANAAGAGFGTDGTWGGVVKTGGRGSVFFDDNNVGAFGIAGFAAMTGKHVPTNDTADAVAGVYFRPYRGENDALRIGVNLTYFGFDKNLSFYTYGQGGYFSPQHYEAITFPVEYQGRTGRWSYLAAVALGVQHFSQDQSNYFPEDPTAQAALVALVGPGSAVYPGHVTTGLAADLRGQIEYAVANDLAIGVAGSFDNGHSYNEGVVKLYVRKTFDAAPQVTAILPGSPMVKP